MRRNISLALFAIMAGLTVVGTACPASAEAMQDSYCLQGRSSGYPGNCEFSSYKQCAATARGTGEACGINPMQAYRQQRRYRSHY